MISFNKATYSYNNFFLLLEFLNMRDLFESGHLIWGESIYHLKQIKIK